VPRGKPRRALTNREFAVTVLAMVLVSMGVAALLSFANVPFLGYVVAALIIFALTLSVVARGRSSD
jgi:hypothetical protein